jgi:hypothetical protein
LGKRISASPAVPANEEAKILAAIPVAARLQPRLLSKAARGLRVAVLVTGLAASCFVSYEFSLRAAVQRGHRAWVLATSPDAARRNGALAVQLAEAACLQTQYRQPALIATLAAAYAEADRFDEAIGAAQMAGKMASEAGDEPLLEQCRETLKSYLRHEPYRDPAP